MSKLLETLKAARRVSVPLSAANLKKVVKKIEVLENGFRQARACL